MTGLLFKLGLLTAAEVIDELIKLAKAIQESDKLAEELNLTEYEYAFYSAVADNESARELMQKEILRELAEYSHKSTQDILHKRNPNVSR